MILWTNQSIDVYNQILHTGKYACVPAKCPNIPDFKPAYDWLVEKMKERVGHPPQGVTYPVWAWYMMDNKRKKPDLRSERWHCGGKYGSIHVCLEIDVPDDKVVLTDFNDWHHVLNDWPICCSEDEFNEIEAVLDSPHVPINAKQALVRNTWDNIFNISHLRDGWSIRGEWVQATFWQLEKQMIRNARFFKCASKSNP